ncbi:MAG: carboxypeptidase-like regulatory domain-containing protein [Bacteroidota bacterium]
MAQTTVIQGQVMNAASKEPAAFCHVILKKLSTGAVTDLEGFFALSIEDEFLNDTLVVQTMGFDTKEIPVMAYLKKQQNKIYIRESTILLETVTVVPPKTIFERVKENIENNYITEDFRTDIFFRKASYEQGEFKLLVEAVAEVYAKKGYKKRSAESLKINLLQLRISDDYRTYKYPSGLNPLLQGFYQNERIKNAAVLNRIVKRANNLEKVGVTTYDGEDVLIFKDAVSTYYVGSDNYELFRVDVEGSWFASSHHYAKYKGKMYLVYQRRELKFTKELHDKWKGSAPSQYPDHWKNHLPEKLPENSGQITESYATNIVLGSEQKLKPVENINRDKDIYEAPYIFNDQFWQDYAIPSESYYYDKIVKDLSTYKYPLEEQFRFNGAINNQKIRSN